MKAKIRTSFQMGKQQKTLIAFLSFSPTEGNVHFHGFSSLRIIP